MGRIDRQQYPELDKLLWDTKAKYLQPEDALSTYERRWGFVNKDELTKREKELIQNLANEAGGFLTAHV